MADGNKPQDIATLSIFQNIYYYSTLHALFLKTKDTRSHLITLHAFVLLALLGGTFYFHYLTDRRAKSHPGSRTHLDTVANHADLSQYITDTITWLLVDFNKGGASLHDSGEWEELSLLLPSLKLILSMKSQRIKTLKLLSQLLAKNR